MTTTRSGTSTRLLSRAAHRILFAAMIFFTARVSAQAPANGQLHMAVRNRDTTAVKLLLSGGFNADLKDSDGITPRQRLALFAAAIKKDSTHTGLPVRAAALRKSIDTGIADINDVDVQGYTPLQLAASFGFNEIIEILLARGAEVNAGGRWNLTDLEGMEDYRDHSTPLGLAAQADRTATVKLLLSRGAYANGVQTQLMSPLQEAVRKTNIDMARLLLENGASAKSAHWIFGRTALHEAVDAGNAALVTLLLDNGADVNAWSKIISEGTPLQAAVRGGRFHLVDLMEKHYLANIKNPRDEFAQLLQRYRNDPNESLRRLLIQLGGQLEPAPAVPEDARQHFVEGTTIIKQALNPEQEMIAVKSLLAAIEIAPWWREGYYSLGGTYDLMKKYEEAEKNFRYYLLSNPGEAGTRDAKDRIYSIGARRKLAAAEISVREEAEGRAAAARAAEAARFSWILDDWTLKSGGMFSNDPPKTIRFVLNGLNIVDATRTLSIKALIREDGGLDWGRTFDMDHCNRKGMWDRLQITFSSDRRSAKILFPIVGLKCEIVYNEAQSSGTITRN